MRSLAICSLVAMAGMLVGSFPARADLSEDAKLTAFFKGYLDDLFRQRPLEATRLGDHRFDSQLDDLSPKARAGWVESTRKTLRELPRRVDYGKLSRPAQVDFDILKHSLTRDLWLAENTKPYEQDPRVYNDCVNDGVYLLLTQSSLPKETNIKNCIARMAHIPRVVAAAKDSLRNPPRVHTETGLRQNRGAISFYETGIFELVGETPQKNELRTAAGPVVAALKEYQELLEDELLPKAQGDWRIGKEKFARTLEF